MLVCRPSVFLILRCPCLSHCLSASLTVNLLTGQSGLGKSTLMNTLFKSKVSRKSVLATAQEKIPKTIEIKSISHGMKLLNPSTLPYAASVFCLSVSVGLSAQIHSSHIFLILSFLSSFMYLHFSLCQPWQRLHNAWLVTPNIYSTLSSYCW